MSDIFDPEGEGYDDVSAAGMRRNAYGHMGSVKESTDLEKRRHDLPMDSYLMLKGKQHPTWHKAVEAENERGYRILKRGGRYWSVPEDFDGDDEEEEQGFNTTVELTLAGVGLEDKEISPGVWDHEVPFDPANPYNVVDPERFSMGRVNSNQVIEGERGVPAGGLDVDAEMVINPDDHIAKQIKTDEVDI
jgi:hypothetical protein|tara:strand:- start:1921 stop:2490 length:570 start_codon:yes stop_codon:yes gene_type:complete